MSGGGQQTTTQQSSVQLTPEQKSLIGLALPKVQEFASKPATDVIPQFSQVAGFTPAQEAGQNLALQTAPQQASVVGGAADASKLLTSGALLDPSTNPALQNIQGTITANTRDAVNNLLEQALPSIRSGAQLAGPFGGSRQGIAEGIAIGKTGQTVGDEAAKTATQTALTGYTSGLDAMKAALGLAPGTAQALTTPAATISSVGDVQQAQQQAQLSDYYNRLLQTNLFPLTTGQQIAGIASGLPGAGATTTATGPSTQSNPVLQALGGAAALASFLPIPGAQVAGPLLSASLMGASRA